jgi:drug/metabolite transporter (DMT)-like permease
MIFLLLTVVAGVAFNQCLRYGQKHGANILAAVVVNYIVAAVASLGIFVARGFPSSSLLDAHVIAIAVVNGILYFVHILVLLASYRLVGVGISAALARAGTVVPALTAWLAWGETMTPWRWIALALVPVSMLLMRRHESSKPSVTLRGDVVLFACFAMAGAILALHKYAEVHFTVEQREVYKTLLFTVAALSSVGYALARRVSYAKGDIALGVVIGLVNASMLLLVLVCLARFPAVVFYPTLASLEICVNVFASWLLWKEHLLRRQMLGLLLAIGIVLLTNAPSR